MNAKASILESPEDVNAPIPAAQIHYVTAITLTQFRNYATATLGVGRRGVILSGHNGAGKTNILEALSLLSPGAGLRKSRLREMTAVDAPKGEGWVVAAEVIGHAGAVHIGTGLDVQSPTDKRIVRIDSGKTKGQSELVRHVSVLWQTPQMDGLFVDSNTVRRQFLDRLVYNFNSAHLTRINSYDYAMRDRNKLLQDSSRDGQWLEVLEQKMAENGVAIAAARVMLVQRLNAAILQSTTGFPRAHISLPGETEERLAHGEAALDVELWLRGALQKSRALDAATGRAMVGTHRTPLQVRHLAKDMDAAGCSTGEQKAMLLSLLLAHARARAQWQGAAPILLLDEVVAHLDEQRRRELFAEIQTIGAQAWLTGTDAADFSAADEGYGRFLVEDGHIRPA